MLNKCCTFLKKNTLNLNNIISFHTKSTSSNWWSLVELYLLFENRDMTCNFYPFKAVLDHDFITVIILLFISLSVIDCFRLTCTFSANASRQRKIRKKVDLVFFEIGDFECNTILNIFIIFVTKMFTLNLLVCFQPTEQREKVLALKDLHNIHGIPFNAGCMWQN